MKLPLPDLNDSRARRRPILLAASAIGVIAVVTVVAIMNRANGNARVEPPKVGDGTAQAIELLAADLATAELRELRRAIPITGDLQARNQTVVKAKIAGDLRVLSVREGDAVGAGQVVARIDATEADARLAEKLADLEAAKAQRLLAEKNRANQQELLRQNFISQNAYDSTVSTFQVSEAKLKAAEAQVTLARKALDDTLVRSPMAGVVAQRFVQPGEKVAVDTKILSIVDLSELEVEAAVPASDIPSIQIGQEVAFRVEGFGARDFKGRIGRISPEAISGTRSILVYAVIPNRDRALRSGMFAKGEVTVAKRDAAWVVPLGALRNDAQGTFVYALKDGRIARLGVSVGLRDEDNGVAEILSGIDAPAQIVKTDLGLLPIGGEARVVGQK